MESLDLQEIDRQHGLSKLEYRGYDSAGLAVRDGENLAQVVKAKGRLSNLIEKTDNGNALKGTCGIADGETYVASDVPAILKYTRNVYYIGNLEFAKLTPGEAHFYDLNGDEIEKQTTEIKWDAEAAEKGGFEHFMMKEIHEQPKTVQDTLNSVIKDGAIDLSGVEITEEEIKNFEQIYIVACGSAWHVGMAAQYVLEDMADVPVRVELASEFRYRKMPLDQKALVIVVSQSGETADTLAALRLAKEKGITTMAIVNVVGSSIACEADKVFYTLAGPEISVATTKAYSAQLAAMYCLAVQFAKVRGKITEEQYSYYISELLTLPEKMQKALEDKERIQWFAAKYANAHDVFFVGRGIDYRPFGFLPDPNDCHKLILDPVASRYVRLIFELALQGNRTGNIAKILNEKQIPTPAAYHVAENHVYSEQKAWDLQRSHWTSGTVYHVLKNEKYKGTYVGAKFIMPVPCKHRVLRAPLEQQVRIEDSHAAIVTPEEFEQAQKVIMLQHGNHQAGNYTKHQYPLKGKVYCGYCQKLMKYRVLKKLGPSFNCRFSAAAVDSPCKRIPISEKRLEEIVRNALTAQIKQAEHVLEVLHERERKALVCFSALERQEEKLSAEKAEIVKQRVALYEQYADGNMSKEEFTISINCFKLSPRQRNSKRWSGKYAMCGQ